MRARGPVESVGSGERGEVVGAGGELLLLQSLLLGFLGSLVSSELVLYDGGIGRRVVRPSGGVISAGRPRRPQRPLLATRGQ
jgi:hypothetical protein